MDQTAQNLQQQIDLYGEPLGDTVRRIVGPLQLTQGGLAQLIGLSAPMLSQLISAQRVKIGNPSVLSRLRAASELADLALAGELDPLDIPDALDRIHATTGALTTSGPTSQLPGPTGGLPEPSYVTMPRHLQQQAALAASIHQPWPGGAIARPDDASPRFIVRAIQDLLREVASTDEIQHAAAAIQTESPALAELLLVYGTGRTADALTHYEQHHG